MPIDLMIPFGILFAIVIGLIYSRQKFEKEILDDYEDKYENWKKNTATVESEEKKECKELVGLIFKTGYNVEVELFDNTLKDRISRGKFNIKED